MQNIAGYCLLRLLCIYLRTRFSEEILTHYNYLDRQKGYIEYSGDGGLPTQSPIISIHVGVVSPSEHEFTDIREITEMAADARRRVTV